MDTRGERDSDGDEDGERDSRDERDSVAGADCVRDSRCETVCVREPSDDRLTDGLTVSRDVGDREKDAEMDEVDDCDALELPDTRGERDTVGEVDARAEIDHVTENVPENCVGDGDGRAEREMAADAEAAAE